MFGIGRPAYIARVEKRGGGKNTSGACIACVEKRGREKNTSGVFGQVFCA